MCHGQHAHAAGPVLLKASERYLDVAEPSALAQRSTPALSTAAALTQAVFLDFDSQTDTGEYVYTASDRTAIRDGIAAFFDPFNIVITNTAPTSGPFSTILFNSGAGAFAEQVDFRNLDPSDNAEINLNMLGFERTSAAFVPASVGIAGHELGHLLGLRHGDSFGPIGSGISPTTQFPSSPRFTGPTNATETNANILASPGTVGSSDADLFNPLSLSARSAIRLAFNESGTVTAETNAVHGSIGTAQALTLPTIAVPNTALPTDSLFGEFLQADAEVVTAEITSAGEQDFYSFTAEAGDLLNIEVISFVLPQRFETPIDPTVRVLDANGDTIDYYGIPAFNDNEFESPDASLIDLIIPEDGTYFIQVGTSSGASDTGGYELYVNRFEIVPEPGSFGLLLVLSAGLIARRRAG